MTTALTDLVVDSNENDCGKDNNDDYKDDYNVTKNAQKKCEDLLKLQRF